MKLKFEVDDSDYIDEPLNVSDFWEGQFVTPDRNKIDCRDCKFVKYDPCSTICEKYHTAKGKPRNIVWNGAKCKYKVVKTENS